MEVLAYKCSSRHITVHATIAVRSCLFKRFLCNRHYSGNSQDTTIYYAKTMHKGNRKMKSIWRKQKEKVERKKTKWIRSEDEAKDECRVTLVSFKNFCFDVNLSFCDTFRHQSKQKEKRQEHWRRGVVLIFKQLEHLKEDTFLKSNNAFTSALKLSATGSLKSSQAFVRQ